ncbi:class I adenylate cyclase [Saccharospirillum salsuginis]|uniref:Adenylate cyclase n=1 Tax=Saccharospirillum salsuginis TaxID=418750 RepID=A0A918K341_9GAMM|nr:class I adenylate cyclase [Saccharospirillum salsuginis]GGX44337.1 adenylate cyclase [Saccharospirillum salsuginis]
MADAPAVTTSTPSWPTLQERRERFLTVNDGRLSRLRDSLQAKQRQCLDLIPLLFHTNLPQAPGYVDEPEIPVGLVNYTPAQGTVQMLQSYQRSVKPADLRPMQPQLMSLYLMGSSGSIAQSTTSDLDIWVCYSSQLSGEQIRLLEYKAHALSQWAEGFNLEVHFFLMDAHHFQGNDQRSLTGENCGSTQHFLLLDEFYRTGQLLAGAPPAWWLVPIEDETHYEATIREYQDKGLLRPEHTIDFGPIPQLPPGEFIGAGLWQLYKGIDSPHKSVLKLLLLEVYAREFPSVTSLAHRYKNAIHSNFLTLNDLDPYAMLYQRIETYLRERGETDRLELVRRCFYFKVGIPMSRSIRTVGWRRRLMQQMVEDWQWSDAYLSYLDGHRNWPVQDVMRERKLLVNELTHSYRFLTQFAAEHQSSHLMSQKDLLILSRKLHAAFDRRRGKIDFISFGQDVDLSHEKVRIHEESNRRQPGQTQWAAYSQVQGDDDEPAALKKTPGLLETLLWCHLNGLLEAHLHIPVFARHQELTEFEVRKTLATLRQALPSDRPVVSQPNYFQPAQIERVLVFINLGCDPLKHLTERGLQKISARSNSLDFSALRENLVATLDLVAINSWGEVMVDRFTGQDALPQAIQFLLTRLGKPNQSQPLVECHCHNQTRPHAIAKRVQDLIGDAMTSLYESLMGRPVRFLYNLGNRYQALFFTGEQIQPVQFESEAELVEWLGSEQPAPSLIRPDRLFDTPRSHLKTVLREQPGDTAITLVYRLTDRQATLYLLDEHGSLLKFRQPYYNLPTLLAPLVRFLRITEHRQRSEEDAFHLHQRSVNCYELAGKGAGDAKLKRARLNGLMQEGRFINLQAVMDRNNKGRYEYQMICNDKEFSTAELGEQFYPAVASYVLGLRAQGQRYPVYITDLALTDRVLASLPYGRAQTMHYVRAKLKLEKRINDAMTKL